MPNEQRIENLERLVHYSRSLIISLEAKLTRVEPSSAEFKSVEEEIYLRRTEIENLQRNIIILNYEKDRQYPGR